MKFWITISIVFGLCVWMYMTVFPRSINLPIEEQEYSSAGLISGPAQICYTKEDAVLAGAAKSIVSQLDKKGADQKMLIVSRHEIKRLSRFSGMLFLIPISNEPSQGYFFLITKKVEGVSLKFTNAENK